MTIDPSLPLILILLALLGLRSRVTPVARVAMKATAERIFGLLDLRDGEEQTWHRSKVQTREIAPETYRMRYTSTLATGREQVSEADFRVVERVVPTRLVIDRAGLEGKSENNQLLRIVADIESRGSGSSLRLAYHWGSRPLIAQLLARTDLWSGIYRLKGVAETGKPDSASEAMINLALAAITGAVSYAAFAAWLGWVPAVVLIVALFIHEFGHLLAFRIIGQPWGRMIFLPFLGGLAVPRLPFESQAQSVFSALMGPGFSLILPALAVVAQWTGAPSAPILAGAGIVASAFNLFNLLPIAPLDGGVALKPMFQRIFGTFSPFALAAVGLIVAAFGIKVGVPVVAVLGVIAVFTNLRRTPEIDGPRPLDGPELAAAWAAFVVVTAGHVLAIAYLYRTA